MQYGWIITVYDLQDELSLAGYRKFEESKNAAPPLTQAEQELKMIKESEVNYAAHLPLPRLP